MTPRISPKKNRNSDRNSKNNNKMHSKKGGKKKTSKRSISTKGFSPETIDIMLNEHNNRINYINRYISGRRYISHNFLVDIAQKVYDKELVIDICDINSYICTNQKIYEDRKGVSKAIIASLDMYDIKSMTDVECILKISSSTRKTSRYNYQDDVLECSLLYEAQVYITFINSLISNKVSPHFLPYVGFGHCSLNDELTNSILGVDSEHVRDILDSKHASRGFRYISYIDILVLPKVNKDTRTLFELFSSKSLSADDFKSIVFQVLYTLETMNRIGLTHNDIHLENIFVTKFSEPVSTVYEMMDGTRYMIKSQYSAIIYDWDFAYSEYVGNNPLIVDFKQLELYNHFIRNHDIAFFLCQIFAFRYFRDAFPSVYRMMLDNHMIYRHTNDVMGCRHLNKLLKYISVEDIFIDAFMDNIISDMNNTNREAVTYSMLNIGLAERNFDLSPLIKNDRCNTFFHSDILKREGDNFFLKDFKA
jgi:hypothetical protein